MCVEDSSIDLHALGRAVVQYTKLSLEKAEASMAKLGPKLKVIHVRYADNVKDSKGVCKAVFDTAGIPFTPEYAARIGEYLDRSTAERKRVKECKQSAAVHEYRPEDYGLTAEGIREEFKEYIEKYTLLEENGE